MEKIDVSNDGKQTVHTKMKHFRNKSQSDVYEKDTTTSKTITTEDGEEVKKTDKVKETITLKRTGSEKYDQKSVAMRKFKTKSGSEMTEMDVIVESETMSLSKGETKSDQAVAKVFLEKPVDGATIMLLDQEKETAEEKEDVFDSGMYLTSHLSVRLVLRCFDQPCLEYCIVYLVGMIMSILFDSKINGTYT